MFDRPILFVSCLSLAAVCAAACAAPTTGPAAQEEARATTQEELAVAASLLWGHAIPVCFNPMPVAGAQIPTQARRDLIRQTVQGSWQRVAGVSFTGWGVCASGAANPNAIVVTLRSGRSKGAIGKSSDNWIGLDVESANHSAEIVHEFGHALGFYHEQVRLSTPDWCTEDDGDRKSDPAGALYVGPWDADSIMNYCNSKYPEGRLSATDIRGVRYFYGGKIPKLAVFNKGTWSIDQNRNHVWDSADTRATFGIAGDQPVIAGEGHMLGVFDGAGLWSFDFTLDGKWNQGDKRFTFGSPGDRAVVGYLAGRGDASRLAVFRNGLWSVDTNGSGAWDTGDQRFTFGSSGDVPVLGNWGEQVYMETLMGRAGVDDRDKLGVFNQGLWSVDVNGNGFWDGADKRFKFGAPGDQPIVGDWDGDGRDNIGVFNPKTAEWSLDMNADGVWGTGDMRFTYGSPGDVAVITDR